jgi:HK97 family phage portal protein
VIQQIKNFLGRKQSAATRAVVAYFTGSNRAVWSDVDYGILAKEGYTRNVIAYRCVEYVAAACAGIEWDLYNRFQRSQREIEQHPLLDLIAHPNPEQTGAEIVHSAVSYRLLSGNTYVERVGPQGKAPRELYVHRPDRMQVLEGDRLNRIHGYKYEANGEKIIWGFGAQQKELLPDKVDGRFIQKILHWKAFHPLNDWYGLSPIEAAARSIDQNNESRAWNVALLQNMATPPGALVAGKDTTITDDQFERLKAMLEEHKGARGREVGSPLLLEGGLEWVPFGMPPAEMAWLEGLRLSSREICTAFGVPPELVGDSQNKTYSNYQEARKAFYEETVLPIMDSLRDALNNWLTPFYGDRLKLDYNRDDIEALQEDRDKLWQRVEKVTFLTFNEKRDAVGYEAYKHDESAEEADKLHVSTQIIPLESYSTFESVTAPDSNAQAEAEAAAKGQAWDRIARADWLSDEQKCELTGFEFKKLSAPPPVAPVINVTAPPVNVTAPPVNVHVITSGKKTQIVHRDEHGRITAIETQESDAGTPGE